MKSWFVVVSNTKFLGSLVFDTISGTLVSNATFLGNVVFAAIKKL